MYIQILISPRIHHFSCKALGKADSVHPKVFASLALTTLSDLPRDILVTRPLVIVRWKML